MKSELIFPESVAGNSGKNQLPEPLRKFYDAFLDENENQEENIA